jgi:hypothetical protein
MSNGANSYVTNVEIDNDSTIKVSLDVDAFMPGELVEISGYVAQNHGAFATFNEFKTITTKLGDTANLTVTATPCPTSNEFQKGQAVTVLLRAAKVWVTVLAEGQPQQLGAPLNVAEPGTRWGKIKGVAGPEKYSSGPWEGNQPASATAGADQAAPEGASSLPVG